MTNLRNVHGNLRKASGNSEKNPKREILFAKQLSILKPETIRTSLQNTLNYPSWLIHPIVYAMYFQMLVELQGAL